MIICDETNELEDTMDLLLGVDLGTTACKVTVVASDLTVSTISSPPYPISAPHREWAEQDPHAWGEAVDTTVQRALDSVGAASHDHVTLSITGQMHSLVLLDADGNPARPAILWADRRATAECSMIEHQVPDVAAITGNPPLPAFTLPQLLWVRRHEPDVLSRTSNVLLPKDYLRWRYTGRVVTAKRSRDWSSRTRRHGNGPPRYCPRWNSILGFCRRWRIQLPTAVLSNVKPAQRCKQLEQLSVWAISSPKLWLQASPMPAIWRSS